MEVVASFVQPNGFSICFNHEDHKRVFGAEAYEAVSRYTDEQLKPLFTTCGEIDAAIQWTFYQDGEAIALAQVNLQQNGFTRRSWLKLGQDLYRDIGRVNHEFHEIKSGPFQTIVIDSRHTNDKQDRALPSTAKLGTDYHFKV
jgi:hypothetical protein